MKKDTEFYNVITKICKDKGIDIKDSSFGYVTELKKDNKVFHIVGRSLELNSASSAIIARDKFACYSLLVQNNIPSIKYDVLFNPKTRSEYENNDIEKAFILFNLYGRKAVIKGNDSSEGKDVFYITNKEMLKDKIIQEFANGQDLVNICPFYDIGFEYRAIYLDGEILFCYKKEKPFVIGDGKKKISKLLENSITVDFYEDLDFDYIPKKGEKVYVSWKHNLSLGGAVDLEIDNETREKVYDLAKRAGQTIGIRFASVDIAETKEKELLVMEINSSVCMDKFSQNVTNGSQIEYEIFSNAIDKMFEG